MLLHSAVDFNMSLMGFAFIVWALLGLLSGNLDLNQKKFSRIIGAREWKLVGIVSIGISIAALFLSGAAVAGGYFADKAVAGAEEGKIVVVKENLEKAVKLDPLESTYKIDLANAYLSIYGVTGDSYYIERAVVMTESTIKNAPKSYFINNNAASFYISIGQIDIALEHLEESIKARPLSIVSYVNKLDGHITAGKYYLSKNQNNLARKVLQSAIETEGQILATNQYSKVPLVGTKEYIQKYGEAAFLQEYNRELEGYSNEGLEFVYGNFMNIDLNQDGNLDMTNISKPANSFIEYSTKEDDTNYIRITNKGEVSGFVYPQGITLEPETEYRIVISARGSVEPGIFKSFMWSNGSENPNQGGLEDIELSPDWSDYAFDIVTSKDIGPDNQHIRLVHSGYDEGFIDISSILIFRMR
jgi:tetratricopeptide (TPR) repeat protein